MTAVAVELLTSPPEAADVPQVGTLNGLAPDAVEFIARHQYPAHDVLAQREQQPAVLRLGTRAA